MCTTSNLKQIIKILLLFLSLSQLVYSQDNQTVEGNIPITAQENGQLNKSDINDHFSTVDTVLISSTTNKTTPQTVGKSDNQGLFLTHINTLYHDLYRQLSEYQRTLLLMVVIFVLFIILITTGRIYMEKRVQRIEQYTFCKLSEHSEVTDMLFKNQPCSEKNTAIMKNMKFNVAPIRPLNQPLPTPAKQIQLIIDYANSFNHIRVKPWLLTNSWGLGLATAKGNVRSENQDYGLCFKTNGYDVLIVADGCGGVPYGQKAAYLVTVSAAISLIRTFGMTLSWLTTHINDAIEKAIQDAAHRLAIEGDKLNITDIRGGLRTTLIIVIGNKHEIGYAYIGDGGGYIVKSSSGEVHSFLEPQKANEFSLNVLAASLGPKMEGEPVTGVLKRSPGDLLIVGTDGIFDRVDKDFPNDVLRGCIHYNGDLNKAAEHIINELAMFRDGAGYICDDNLTLGIMGDGTIPKLSEDI